ncbi:platelet glycoprotein 4-like [Erythrolamprus reginae]|uniref:platelet glycoprotein 4-like n=1 Tax=Erythrolamprus reginae TaxID=121349 RepID=UPI00396CABD5
MGCNLNCGLLTLATIGAILAILGGILIPVGNYFIDKTVRKEVVIENGTIAYDNWIVPGSPIYREFWFFDVQNPEDVMQNGSPPILKQKGPYTYLMRYIPKENIREHDDGTISYLQPNIVLFQPDMSVGPENDTVVTVNFAVVAAPALYKGKWIQTLMNILMKKSGSKFLQTRSVKEILWGYEDPFLNNVPIIKLDTVLGIFYPYNRTFDGPYRIYSGKDDINKKGIIVTYNNSRTLEYWPSYCGMVNGTDATSFHPFIKKSETLYFFSSDICRSIYATLSRELAVKGIPLYRFKIASSALASAAVNPNNICFCNDKNIFYNCTSSALLDVSGCKKGKPVYISLPHFLEANPRVYKYVKGLEPNKEEHSIFLDVEPITGFTLAFAKRLQVNFLVKPNAQITALQKVQHRFYFPVLWLNESAIVSDEKAEFFRSKVTNKVKLLHFLQWALMIVGSVMFLGFLFAFFIRKGGNPK